MPALPKSPETTYRIHFQDCDPFGHLNNARYLDYFLNAREDHVEEHYALNLTQLASKSGAGWVVTKHHLAYLRPANHGDTVLIRSQIIHFDNSNIVVEMQMRDETGSRLKALLWSELAFVNIASATRTDHSDQLMELLDDLDVEEISYDPDGFDERVRRLRKELKRERAE